MRALCLSRTLLLGLAGLSLLLPSAAGAADRWVPLGPYGGPVADIAVAPSEPRTLYAATESGVYRSDNAGARWRAARRGLPPFIKALAVDPTDHRTVYVGIGGNVAGGAPSIYKTDDGGATWTALSLTDVSITELAIDPRDPSTLLASGIANLFRSDDAGATWDLVDPHPGTLAPFFENVAFDPTTPGIAYAGSRNFGMFKSTDGGVTWAEKNQGLPPSVWQLDVSPSGVLYVASVPSSVVYRSVDKGESWTLLGALPDSASVQAFGFSGEEVFAGTTLGIYRKNETGPGWTAVRPGQREDIRAFATDPEDDETLYAGIGFYGGFRGVLESVDGGATWRSSNQGLAGNAVVDAEIAPSNPRVLYVSVASAIVARSANGGATWRLASPPADVTIFELAVDPRNENVVYAAGEYGRFWRTTDGGRSWVGDPVEDGECVSPTSLTFDPRNPDRLLLAGFKGLGCVHGGEESCFNLESTDRGRTWSCLEGARDASFFSLLADPRRSATLYGGGSGGFFKSTDGGAVWEPFNTGIVGDVLALAISRNGILWAGGSSVYKSRNGGMTWRRSASGLPLDSPQIRELVAAPSNPAILYAAVAVFDIRTAAEAYDLYVSTNGGASWRPLPERGLPVPVFPGFRPLLVDPRDPGRLYVGTPLGLYRLDGATE